MEQSLIVVEKLDPVVIFTEKGVDSMLAKITKAATSFVPDVSTADGRQEISSMAYKVKRSKTALDNLGKARVAGWKTKAKRIDVGRKRLREQLDLLTKNVRQPLTDWEDGEARKEALRKQQEETRAQDMVDTFAKYDMMVPFTMCLAMTDSEYREQLSEAMNRYQAAQAAAAEEERMRKEEAERLLAERVELELLRKEQAEREAKAREALEKREDALKTEREAIEAEKRFIEEAKRLQNYRQNLTVEVEALQPEGPQEQLMGDALRHAHACATTDALDTFMPGAAARAELERDEQLTETTIRRQTAQAAIADKERDRLVDNFAYALAGHDANHDIDNETMENAINIILNMADEKNPVFVEIENDDGKSIRIGERSTHGNLTKIRITTADIYLRTSAANAQKRDQGEL